MSETSLNLPFSQASENNKRPILAKLKSLVWDGASVLEIGAGTAQHAVFFASQLPGVHWQPTDQQEYLPGISARVAQAGLENVLPPRLLDVRDANWDALKHELSPAFVYTANTAHIMHWEAVVAMFRGIGQLDLSGAFIQYGPFNRAGAFTSGSNRQFDASLRSRDPGMGIRDDGALIQLASECGLHLDQDFDMPANNRLLIWKPMMH